MPSKHVVLLSVLVVLVIALGAAGFLSLKGRVYETDRSTPVATEPVRSQDEIQQAWRISAQAAVAQYRQDQNAEKARDALVALKVANADRDVHLALVLAFEGKRQNVTGAGARLEQALKAAGF